MVYQTKELMAEGENIIIPIIYYMDACIALAVSYI